MFSVRLFLERSVLDLSELDAAEANQPDQSADCVVVGLEEYEESKTECDESHFRDCFYYG